MSSEWRKVWELAKKVTEETSKNPTYKGLNSVFNNTVSAIYGAMKKAEVAERGGVVQDWKTGKFSELTGYQYEFARLLSKYFQAETPFTLPAAKEIIEEIHRKNPRQYFGIFGWHSTSSRVNVGSEMRSLASRGFLARRETLGSWGQYVTEYKITEAGKQSIETEESKRKSQGTT
jgi:hypothetical protein